MTRRGGGVRLAFAAAGTIGLAVLVIVAVTGGFVLEAGPFRLSVRGWRRPLLLTGAAWAMAAWGGRKVLASTAACIGTWLEMRALAGAVLLSVAAAAVGIGFGTWAASAADASGYVSQAALIASGRLTVDEPLIQQVGWPDAPWAFSPLGYRPGVEPGTLVPTYPPGLPLLMALAWRAAGEWGPFLVVPLLGGVTVFGAWALGASLHSRAAGLFAAVMQATSPIFLFQVVQAMSDVPAAAGWTIAIWLALGSARRRAAAAGVVAGMAVLVRPNLLPLVAVVGMIAATSVLGGRERIAWDRLLIVIGLSVPAVVTLAAIQTGLYGSPLSAGYGSFGEIYDWRNVLPNLTGYAWRLVRGEGVTLAAAACACALVVLRRRAAEVDVGRAVLVAAAVLAAVGACYLPYAVFEEWSYLRFLLPAFPAVFAAGGALLVEAGQRLPLPTRGVVAVVAGALIGSVNVTVAAREQAFALRSFEARYLDAGRYLDAALPPEAVVFAVQQSGSVRHYTRRPIVRWDLLQVDLDTAVDDLRALGRTPVLLVEDWEEAGLGARFPSSAAARLDWLPHAEFGDATRVRLYHPADRGKPGVVVTDRIR